MGMNHGVIYGLHDSNSGELRYIGQTVNSVTHRLSQHLVPSSLKRHSYLARWLLGLVNLGTSPTWSVLAEAQDQAELDRLEVEHIARARADGIRLVNLSDGGGGRAGYMTPQDTKDKIAASQIGVPKPKHTEEWKVRMSELKTGVNTNTPEHMTMLAEMKRGVPRSEATKARISSSRMGQPSARKGVKHTAESRALMSTSLSGKHLGAKHPGYRHDISTSEILRMLGEGMTREQVAERFGVARTFVQRRIKEAKRDGLEVPQVKHSSWNKGVPHSPQHMANWRSSRWGTIPPIDGSS